jgi:hypothetical protein
LEQEVDALQGDFAIAARARALEMEATPVGGGGAGANDAECVETSPLPFAQLVGATPADHQVELDEAESDDLLRKIDATTESSVVEEAGERAGGV